MQGVSENSHEEDDEQIVMSSPYPGFRSHEFDNRFTIRIGWSIHALSQLYKE